MRRERRSGEEQPEARFEQRSEERNLGRAVRRHESVELQPVVVLVLELRGNERCRSNLVEHFVRIWRVFRAA